MDVNPVETVESLKQQAAETAAATAEKNRLNAAVAVTVALLATFMAICKVKDDNIVQAMQQAQADKVDHWGYYQARNIRQELAEATALQLKLARKSAPPAVAADYDEAIARYDKLAAEQVAKKAEVKAQAEADQQRYDALNLHDDQFDLSDALLAIAVALLAVTALTGMWPLFWVALVPTVGGVLMGLAGLLEWGLHPDALVKLLS